MYESKSKSGTSTAASTNMAGEVNVNKIAGSDDNNFDLVINDDDVEAIALDGDGKVGDMVSKSVSDGDDSTGKNDGDNQLIEFKDSDTFSLSYVGIPVQGFIMSFMGYSMGLLIFYFLGPYGRNLPTAQLSAAASLSTLFHTYSILFGIWVDTFPIMGLAWKPYLVIGWLLYLAFNIPIIILGESIETETFVILIAMAQFGLQLAITSVDAMLPWITSREPEEKKGRFQTIRDLISTIGIIFAMVYLFISFSGPTYNCPGYEPDPTVPCTTDETTVTRNSLSTDNPDDWCHMICPDAVFGFDSNIPTAIGVNTAIILCGFPFIFFLDESKKVKKDVMISLGRMWRALTNRAVWQVALYSLIFGTLLHCENSAYTIFTAVHISQSTLLPLISVAVGTCMAALVLFIIMKYGLHFSWHKLILVGIVFDVVLELSKFFFVFEFTRSPYLWVIATTPAGFLSLLTSLPMAFAINVIAEPGLEAATVALIGTTATLSVFLAKVVISQPLLSFFPLLSDTEEIVNDTKEVRLEFLKMDMICIVLKIFTIYFLPMFPRQRVEAKALRDRDERSTSWAGFTAFSITVLLLYSSCAAVLPFAIPTTRCLKVLGGNGCSEDETDVFVILNLVCMIVFCLAIPTVAIYWPIVTKKEKFSWDMFL